MKKKWFTQTTRIDHETGEILSESKIKREKWINIKKSETKTKDCGGYYLKETIIKYERNRQTRLEL